MATQIFVNLPVKDLQRSVDFFSKLGYAFNRQFTNENATCMIISENISAMLLVESFFSGFSKKEICDTSRMVESIICLSAESKEEVDDLVDRAIAAGAVSPNAPQDEGFMYGRGFHDLDGHQWEIMYMNTDAFPKN